MYTVGVGTVLCMSERLAAGVCWRVFFFQAEDGIRYLVRSRGLGDVYKRQVVKDNPSLVMRKIRVSGHTDNMGKEDDNRKLSLRRAEAVRKYLISQDGNFRIEVAGLGETQPLVKCDAKKPRPELIRCLAPNRRGGIEPIMGLSLIHIPEPTRPH